MSKYTDHKHNWNIEYNNGGLLLVKCKKCELSVELFDKHVTLADYTFKGADGLHPREFMPYDELLVTKGKV